MELADEEALAVVVAEDALLFEVEGTVVVEAEDEAAPVLLELVDEEAVGVSSLLLVEEGMADALELLLDVVLELIVPVVEDQGVPVAPELGVPVRLVLGVPVWIEL